MSTFDAKNNEVFTFERQPFNPVHAVIDGRRGDTPLFFSHDIVEALRFASPSQSLRQ